MLTGLTNTYAYLSKGGPVMGLIILCSIVVLALVIERFRALRRESVIPSALLSEMEQLVLENKFSDLLALCRASDTPLARILRSGLAVSQKDKTEIQSELELVGRRETSRLERNLSFLGTLAAVGPLLGLLGTVTGMIRTFSVIRVMGVGDPLELSAGIAEALLNTAGGLIVGIPALVIQRYFFGRVDEYVLFMEEFTQGVFRKLKEK